MNPNSFTSGRRGSSFLNYNYTPSGDCSVTIGSGASGSKSFVAPVSGIPTDGGTSETYLPGLKKQVAGPATSWLGVIKDRDALSKLIPVGPMTLPDITGLPVVAGSLIGVATILRSNLK